VQPVTIVRIGLAVFVFLWLLNPIGLQSTFPIWLVFLIALGLEVHFFLGALRPARSVPRSREPQPVDRERYGYEEADELVIVREGGEELWIPYSGESPEELEELIEEARAEPEAEEVAPVVVEERSRLQPVLRFLVGLGVIGALALVLWFVERNTGWNGLDAETRAAATQRFSDEASRVAGKQVEIRCDESGEFVGAVQHADGVALVGGDLAYLTPERCHQLYRLAFKGEVKAAQTGRAIAVLAHESWHLRGVREEGATECYALQTGVALGQRLGLSEGRAQQLMRQQLVENSLRRGSSSEYRVPPDCEDGGRLDLNPASDRFP
jgi:hypothetical protein